jgi:hypothetical protein
VLCEVQGYSGITARAGRQTTAGGGAAGVGEDDGWRPAHLAARALPPREVVYLFGTFVSLLYRSLADVE